MNGLCPLFNRQVKTSAFILVIKQESATSASPIATVDKRGAAARGPIEDYRFRPP
jgi:hypothetical protein